MFVPGAKPCSTAGDPTQPCQPDQAWYSSTHTSYYIVLCRQTKSGTTVALSGPIAYSHGYALCAYWRSTVWYCSGTMRTLPCYGMLLRVSTKALRCGPTGQYYGVTVWPYGAVLTCYGMLLRAGTVGKGPRQNIQYVDVDQVPQAPTRRPIPLLVLQIPMLLRVG